MKWIWLTLFVLCCLGAAACWQWVPQDQVQQWTQSQFAAYENHVLSSKTTHLPHVDRVEVLWIRQPDGPILPGSLTFPKEAGQDGALVLRVGEVTGAEAEALAALWRSRTFSGPGGASRQRLEEPMYALRFFRGNELLFETSLTWYYGYGTINVLGVMRHFEFDDQNLELADRLQQIVPVDTAMQAEFEFWRGWEGWCGNRWPQAIAAFERSLQLDPQQYRSCNMLARSHVEAGNLGAAIVAYDHLLRCSHKDWWGDDGRHERWLTNLALQAVLYHKVGETERALASLAIIEGQAGSGSESEFRGLLLAWRIYNERDDQTAVAPILARLKAEHRIDDPAEYTARSGFGI